MVEDQIEDNNNDQTDVTMEDNEQIPAAKPTAMAAGDFSQFNNNNRSTTTNTSAKTDMIPPNE